MLRVLISDISSRFGALMRSPFFFKLPKSERGYNRIFNYFFATTSSSTYLIYSCGAFSMR
jgi:hypothetical protein